jgi:hypothetical protein
MKAVSELQKGKESKGKSDSSGRDTRNDYWPRTTEANSIMLGSFDCKTIRHTNSECKS